MTDQEVFDEFVWRFVGDLTVPTARQVAQEIGVNFDPADYDPA